MSVLEAVEGAAAGVQARPAGALPAYCFVLPWPLDLTGGVNTVVRALITEMAAQKQFRPLLLQLDWNASPPANPTGPADRLSLRLRSPWLQDHPVASAVKFIATLPGSLLKLARIVRQNRIAALNMHFPDLAAIDFIILKRLGLFRGKVILSVHGSDIRAILQFRPPGRRLWRFLFEAADTVVACSNGLAEEVRMLAPLARIVTIYNGIDVNAFSPDPNWNPETRDIPRGKRLIVNIASFEPRKGHGTIVTAFKEVALRFPDAHLVCVGRAGPASSSTRALIQDLGLSGRISILNSIPYSEVPSLIASAEIFLLGSRWVKGVLGEGFPMAILEAAAVGVPVVSTATCGVSELIEDGVSGRVTPLDDPGAMAKALFDLLESPESATRMAMALRRRVINEFSWTAAYQKYVDPGAEDFQPGAPVGNTD